MLASGALFVGVLAPGVALRLAEALRPFIERPHAFALDAADLAPTLHGLLGALAWILLPAVLLFLGAALASGLIQHGPVWSAAPLAPKLERVSPTAGAKRLFSLRSLVEFAKGLVKIVLVGAAAAVLLWPAAPRVLAAIGLEAGPLLALLHTLALRLLIGVAALAALSAVLDSLYQRFEQHKQLRMSRRELQDEFKQTEGDPFLKARLQEPAPGAGQAAHDGRGAKGHGGGDQSDPRRGRAALRRRPWRRPGWSPRASARWPSGSARARGRMAFRSCATRRSRARCTAPSNSAPRCRRRNTARSPR